MIIALALRQTLEQDGQTAALVTPDRLLARRVASELARWQIAIDDSAALWRTLRREHSSAFGGSRKRRVCTQLLLAVLKHPFARLEQDPASFRHQARALDRLALRGLRPDPGLDGIAKAITRAKTEARDPETTQACEALTDWWSGSPSSRRWNRCSNRRRYRSTR